MSTCLEFSPLKVAPWYSDFSLPTYYANNSGGSLTAEFIGKNIGYATGDDAKMFIFPMANWQESTGNFGTRKTCVFSELVAVE